MTAAKYILWAIALTLLTIVALAALGNEKFIEPISYALTTEVGALAMTLKADSGAAQ